MKKVLIFAVATASLSAFSATPAPTYKFISTEQIVAMCKNTENQRDQGYCGGFGQGVYDGYLQMTNPKKGKQLICIPEGTKDPEIVSAYIKWAEQNPKYNNKPASESVLNFLDQRYPCKK